MNFLNVLTEPAIIIITVVFLSFIMTVLHNYRKIEKNLKPVFDFLHALNKKEISYRFNQLDEFMSNNYLTSICWEDFKKALIFPDKFLATSQETTNIRNYSSDIYLTGQNSDLNIVSVNQSRADKTVGDFDINTVGTGNIIINDDLVANVVQVNSAESINSLKNLSANSNISLVSNGGDITVQNVESTNSILSINSAGGVTASNLKAKSDIDVKAVNGNIVLNNLVNSTSGNVSISNESFVGSISVNGVNANSYSITNNANGLINVDGIMSNQANSVISANSNGANAGIVVADTSVLNNNASLMITNSGQSGIKLDGKIDNSLTDSSSVVITNNAGALEILADIENGATNNLQIINNGIDAQGKGIVFSDGVINNYGTLSVENNLGTMTVAGQIDSQVGSSNNFVNASDDDFIIGADINIVGNTLTLENKGAGSLIIGELADIKISDVGIQKGVLNIESSSDKMSGAIDIIGSITNNNLSGGILNITNNRDGGINVKDGVNIDVQNVNIYNTSGDINISDLSSVTADDVLAIYNNANGADININGKLQGSDININSQNSDINIAHNKSDGNIVATNNVIISVGNANINNSSTVPLPNTVGIVAGSSVNMSANNIGTMDSTLNNVTNDGFVLDPNNAININANIVNADATN